MARSARRSAQRPTGRRVLAWLVLAAVIVIGIGAIGYFTPLMSVRDVSVADNKTVSVEEIRSAAGVADGTPLLQVDTAAAAQKVAAIAGIESARVQRTYPSTLTITVVERQPVALVTEGEKVHVLDRNGVAYLHFEKRADMPKELAALPVFSGATPGPTDPSTLAAMKAAAGLPESISRQVTGISATSPVDISFALTNNRTVVWGDAERGDEKARTLEYLLTRKATVYNVSSPEFPAFR